MSGVLYRKGDGPWESPQDSGYVNEDQLQNMIYQFPELLPGTSANSHVCREFSTDSGPIDNLIINSDDGSITLVECKLARNPEVRRKIIGQIIDYAASLSKLSFEEFHYRWRNCGGADLTVIDTPTGPLSLKVSSNLEAAQFTLLLAVDEINEPLKEMVVFINKKTDASTRVALIELARHVTGDIEILIPQTFGYEALKPAVSAYEKRTPWTKEEFSAWLLTNEPQSLKPFENFMDIAETAGFHWGGTKSETPSGAICVRTGNKFRYPLVFHTFDKATVETRFIDFRKDDFVEELLSFLENIEGINADSIRANGYSAKPKIEVSRFADSKIIESLLNICTRVAQS